VFFKLFIIKPEKKNSKNPIEPGKIKENQENPLLVLKVIKKDSNKGKFVVINANLFKKSRIPVSQGKMAEFKVSLKMAQKSAALEAAKKTRNKCQQITTEETSQKCSIVETSTNESSNMFNQNDLSSKVNQKIIQEDFSTSEEDSEETLEEEPFITVLSAKSEQCLVLKDTKILLKKCISNSTVNEHITGTNAKRRSMWFFQKNSKRGPKLFLPKIKNNKTSSEKCLEETIHVSNNKQSNKWIKRNILQFNNKGFNGSSSKNKRSRSFYKMFRQFKWQTIEQGGTLSKLLMEVQQQRWSSGSTEDTYHLQTSIIIST
jgi:hypothetical protein